MKLRQPQSDQDQWDGTDIEPVYPSRYPESNSKADTSDLSDDYIRSYNEGDRFA